MTVQTIISAIGADTERFRTIKQPIIIRSGIEGAFIYTYIAPSYPSSRDRVQALDAASYALVRSWPDGRTEPKAAYHTVAQVYGGRD